MKKLVIVPVYNEERHIRKVLEQIRAGYKGDLLTVNDGSTDGSAAEIVRFGDVIRIDHEKNSGYGSSLISGFRYALENGYDRMVTIDCDEQHQPHHIASIFDGMGEVDVYSGSRYLAERITDDAPPPDRYRINMVITGKINSITGYNLTDSFCGMKGYRVKALEKMDLHETGYAFPIEFWIQAYNLGLTVAEFPVERIYKNLERSFGEKLDNPEIRLNYYNKVLKRELDRWSISSPLELTRTI